jgi:NADH dehydrogenase/NADH:ubiquinone oxidoreductase subunit G
MPEMRPGARVDCRVERHRPAEPQYQLLMGGVRMSTTVSAAENIRGETITLTIDGKRVEVPKGASVLEAAQAAGIYVPTLCHDPDLQPYGACRLCVVEIEGLRGIVSSCTTPALDKMVVHTETPKVNQARRVALELILTNHPTDCLTCAKNQQCELQKVARYLGIEQEHFSQIAQEHPVASDR